MENKNIVIDVVDNTEKLYEGDLWYYFWLIFTAPNIHNPYHNFRHMLHVTCSGYIGGKYEHYHEIESPRDFRAFLIACLFHDYAHSGMVGDDPTEVARAIKEMKKHLLESDWDLVEEIESLIRATQFPHEECKQSLGVKLIRDCDLSQSLSDVWMQNSVIGLSKEMKIAPLELLQGQEKFLSSIHFQTNWAQEKFPPLVHQRINEIKKMLISYPKG